MGILLALTAIFFTCLFIWRACDGFEVASRYLGRNLSDGVRGGTINAIASSTPELFTTLIALLVLSDQDGFAVGIGTTAGSALFNGLIIPAVCVFAVVGRLVLGTRVGAVTVQRRVILRDGLALILCEVLLLLFVSGTRLRWWQGALMIGLYAVYLIYTLLSMRRRASQHALSSAAADQQEHPETVEQREERAPRSLVYWLSLGPLLDFERHLVGDRQRARIAAGTWNAWPLLLTSTAAIGLSCWLLILACEALGAAQYEFAGQQFAGLDMPTMFVAVIFAAAATSVPDTIISLRDAKSGEYDDAVSNALGSNIFDICFALGFPLFLFTALNGDIVMPQSVADRSAELRLLLLALTVVSFLVYLLGKTARDGNGNVAVAMGRGKATILLGVYALFVAYIIGLSTNADWAHALSAELQQIGRSLPSP